MTGSTYRPIPAIGLLGTIVLLFWTYVICYATGITDWKLFAKVSSFRPAGYFVVSFLIINYVVSVVCILTFRIRVVLAKDRLEYRGLLGTVQIQWREVRQLRYGTMGVNVFMATAQENLRIRHLLLRNREMVERIVQNVRQASPGAEIVEFLNVYQAGARPGDHGWACPGCSYNLRGNATMTCPECERPFTYDELGTTEKIFRSFRP